MDQILAEKNYDETKMLIRSRIFDASYISIQNTLIGFYQLLDQTNAENIYSQVEQMCKQVRIDRIDHIQNQPLPRFFTGVMLVGLAVALVGLGCARVTGANSRYMKYIENTTIGAGVLCFIGAMGFTFTGQVQF